MSVLNIRDTTARNVKFMSELKMGIYSFDAGAAQATLATTYPPVILCDPGGGAIDLLLPAEADSEGLMFFIFNTADAAEAITVKEDGDTTTIITLDQNQSGLVVCDGTTWRGFIGGIT